MLDGAGTQEQLLGDGRVPGAVAEEAQDVELPGCQGCRVGARRGAGPTRDADAELAQLVCRSSRIPRNASITFARASSRVRPWLFAPGTSGIDATIQPSSPSSKTMVTCSDSLIAANGSSANLDAVPNAGSSPVAPGQDPLANKRFFHGGFRRPNVRRRDAGSFQFMEGT